LSFPTRRSSDLNPSGETFTCSVIATLISTLLPDRFRACPLPAPFQDAEEARPHGFRQNGARRQTDRRAGRESSDWLVRFPADRSRRWRAPDGRTETRPKGAHRPRRSPGIAVYRTHGIELRNYPAGRGARAWSDAL